MKVEGTHWESKKVFIDVKTEDVISTLKKEWFKKHFPDQTKKGLYINRENRWEECTEYYHGSDSYTDHGPADDSALDAKKMFDTLKLFAKEFDAKEKA